MRLAVDKIKLVGLRAIAALGFEVMEGEELTGESPCHQGA